MNMYKKYKYSLNGATHYLWLTPEEKSRFETKYGLILDLWDEVNDETD